MRNPFQKSAISLLFAHFAILTQIESVRFNSILTLFFGEERGWEDLRLNLAVYMLKNEEFLKNDTKNSAWLDVCQETFDKSVLLVLSRFTSIDPLAVHAFGLMMNMKITMIYPHIDDITSKVDSIRCSTSYGKIYDFKYSISLMFTSTFGIGEMPPFGVDWLNHVCICLLNTCKPSDNAY